jgi:pimeloyl-ACP methyl ester carboxylesterase
LIETQFAFSTDGTRIAFDVGGEGPPLMLLHGGGHHRRYWHDAGYVDRVAADFTVIAIDIRGSGDSDKPEDPTLYTIAHHCADILAVADACGVDRFSLWGYSYGGNIGRYLAARSARVTSLIMVGIPFGAAASGEFREMILRLREQRSGFEPANIAWLLAMLDWPDNAPADLRCPTLWIVGSNNPFAMASVAKHRATLAESQVQVQIIDGLNHEQEFSEIDAVLAPMLAFARSWRAGVS